jgi:fatty-acyl-CoA synthase
VNAPRKWSYQHGVGSKPLLSEHVSERLRNVTKIYPNNLAVVSAHQGIEWTYEEFNQRVDSIAKGLIAIGLKKGDRVGIYSPNYAEWTLL